MLISTVLFRFTLAFVASFLFGFVRQRMGKPIGFGTFIFLAQGSCALALTAITLQSENPLPLLSSIVTGIGFLGAGALFRSGERVVGFTSAATIWAFAILGLTLGVGEYLIAGLLYTTIWTVVFVDLYMQRRWIGSHQRKLELEIIIGTTDAELETIGIQPRSVAQQFRLNREAGAMTLTYMIHKPDGETEDLIRRLEASPAVRHVSIEA